MELVGDSAAWWTALALVSGRLGLPGDGVHLFDVFHLEDGDGSS
ncbi:hypothetical protein [Mycobacterium sp.]